MSEKGQGQEMLPGGTGTVLAEPGTQAMTTPATQPRYEGRQPTDAEREAGRWLDDPSGSQPTYEGRQPTDAEREAGRWLDDPSGGNPRSAARPAQDQMTGAVMPSPAEMTAPTREPEARGRPSEGPTKIEYPSFEVNVESKEDADKATLEYMDTEGETDHTDDDPRSVMA